MTLTDQAAQDGDQVTFTTDATGASGLNYQWETSTDGTNWDTMTGETSKSLKVTCTADQYFRCKLTNGWGNTVYTDKAKLWCVKWTTQPKDTALELNKHGTFTAAVNYPGATLQWERSYDGGETWNPIENQDRNNLIVTAELQEATALYRCVATVRISKIYSDEARLTIKDQPVYATRYYMEELDGTYTFDHGIDGRTIATGTAGQTVAAVDRTVEHYKLNEDKSTLSGVQDEDSILLLPYYLDREIYDVNFHNWDGKDGVQTEKVKYEDTVKALPTVPARDHYTFDGWYLDQTFTQEYDQTVKVEQNTEVYAKWTPEPFALTFDTDGGTAIEQMTVGYEQPVTPPADPEKEGYTFTGWDKAIPTTMPAENLTFKAQWEINQYTLTFDPAGGSAIDPITQNYGTAVTAPDNPTKDGYTFDGWDAEVPATMPAKDTTLTAKWKVNQYTITFDTDGGSAVNPITQDYGTAVTKPADPTKDGYTFDGWDAEVPATMPAKDTTLTAKWKVNRYTITFDTAGGTAIDPITQNYGTAVTAPENPTKDGYTFDGWDPAVPETMPAKDTTLTAKWKVNQYTITFDTDGGSAVEPITLDVGSVVAAPAAPSKDGFVFDGWTPALPATMPSQDLTVKANWKEKQPDQYTLIFDTAGGSAINPITLNVGAAVTAPADPVKDGYTFNGWSPTVPETMPSQDLILTAKWKVNQYTITFDTDGGNEIAPITLDYGTEVTAPENPTKDGYSFDGWDTDIPATMPAKDTTLTAKWKVNQYTITFDTDGGSAVEPITLDMGAVVAAPASPSKDGFVFDGWTPALPATMPSQDLTVKANWKEKQPDQYTLTFDTAGGSAINPITLNVGAPVTAPTNPVKDGFTFAGWSPAVPETMPAENLTLKAQWEEVRIEIEDATAGNAAAPEKLPDTDKDFAVKATVKLPENLVKEEKVRVLMVSYDGAGRYLAMEEASLTRTELNTYAAKAEIRNDGSVSTLKILILDKTDWTPLTQQQEMTK